ncbi:LPXTG cell wall anchor domain-containing protein [Secundilactobacillus odoratitofui]|uniref:Y-family DNA polymerase n=1 Tax=Secundilactobacillus odoratitofui TaxID=480930 RepID=UPI000AC316C4|nr:LPXTG cell wall anchor domain-containing protein [Secundilactobacillus odoratitofui]
MTTPLSDPYRLPVHDILCIDCKSFYASTEAIKRAEFPTSAKIAVLSREESSGGLILAASPYAKQNYGVKLGTRRYELREDMDLKLVDPHMQDYIQLNYQINKIYRQFTDDTHWFPYSIDESFLDVSGSHKLFGSNVEIARAIQDRVFEQTGIITTVGIGQNPLLAKLALDNAATDESVTYTANTATADVTLPATVDGASQPQTIKDVTGKTGQTLTLNVPTLTGYTADKSTFTATVNPDGTITTTDQVVYTKVAVTPVDPDSDNGNPDNNGGTTTPTNPTEPVNPTDPSEPANPTEPVTPPDLVSQLIRWYQLSQRNQSHQKLNHKISLKLLKKTAATTNNQSGLTTLNNQNESSSVKPTATTINQPAAEQTVSIQKATATKNQLPQTSEANSTAISLIGTLLLTLMGLLGASVDRKRRN